MLLSSAETGSAGMVGVTLNAGCPGAGVATPSEELSAVDRASVSPYIILCLCGCESRFYFTSIDVRRASPRSSLKVGGTRTPRPIGRCIHYNCKSDESKHNLLGLLKQILIGMLALVGAV